MDPISAAAPLADTPMAVLFHGRRWSYILSDPVAVLEGSHRADFEAARAWVAARATPPDPDLPPFVGGAAGLFRYEMGAAFEAAAPRFSGLGPAMTVGLYDGVVAFDHGRRRACALAWDDEKGSAGARVEVLAQAIAGRRSRSRGATPAQLAPCTEAAAYEEAVRKVIAAASQGDLFQANIARRFAGRLGAGDHPFAFFERLTRLSPAPHAAFMRLASGALVSNSPERFLRARSEAGVLHLRTAPIKGTRPRAPDAAMDARLAQALQESAKDRAENLMIVDLMRNDLAKVCRPGSVRVPRFCALESFANVHHLVSEVEGEARHGMDAFDAFAAAFPAGSITGAPKVKAMEVIARLEGAPRGAYCGAMAWFGFDGAMDSSVLIRTAWCEAAPDGWSVEFQTGAGVTVASHPEEEAKETTHKARSLLRALGAAAP